LVRDLQRDGVVLSRGAIVEADRALPSVGLERILASHSLVHAAEGDLYRSVVIGAFGRHGITLEPIPRGELASRAARTLGRARGGDAVAALGRGAGPPWRREHKDAASAALAAAAPAA
jgi:hypothetical protein